MTTRTTRTTTDDLVTRLLALCERRTSEGVSYCQVHQVGNRCTTCQAADGISRALAEIGRLRGILERLNIEVRREATP